MSKLSKPILYPLRYACAQALRDAAERLRDGQVYAQRMEQWVTVERADGSVWEGVVGIDLPDGALTDAELAEGSYA